MREGADRAPNSALLQDSLGRLLLEIGSTDALAHLAAADELDPSDVMTRTELARAKALFGDLPAALASLAKMERSIPRDVMYARLALWARTPVEIPDVAKDTHTRLYLDVLEARSLSAEQRAFMARRASGSAGRQGILFLQRNTELFAYVGDVDDAIASAKGAVDAGLIDFLWLERCPILDALHGDLRWPDIRSTVQSRAAEIRNAFHR